MTGAPGAVTQAWIERIGDDPEVFSALSVARSRLAAGRRLRELRRARLVELEGSGRTREEIAALLHASTQIYNPHKERCVVRRSPAEDVPAPPGSRLLLVVERGGARRRAVERWWGHETGERVRVREGVVWMLQFEPGADAEAAAGELGPVRDVRHGLFCNPHAQDWKSSAAPVPLPWIDTEREDSPGRGGTP